MNIKEIWTRWRWNYGSTRTRFEMLIKSAKGDLSSDFSLVLNWEEVDGAHRAFGTMKPYEWSDILHNNEFLFISKRMFKYLIVKFMYHSISRGHIKPIEERIKSIQNKYPRIRYVHILNEHKSNDTLGQNIVTKAGGISICLEEYKLPKEVITSLAKILLEPYPPEFVDPGEGI